MQNADRVTEMHDELLRMSEALTELLVDELRAAVDAGEGRKPPAEKPLSQARRAIEKAARHLAEAAEG